MDDLLEFVPEDKREAFTGKWKESGYGKLTDEIALEHVTKSQSLRDKVATPIAEAALKNFQEKKLPDILKAEREKLVKELHPEETPEQKRIRELEEKLSEKDRREAAENKKAALRKKAGELGYDITKAERLAALEDADDVLADFAADRAELLKKIEDLEKQIKFGARPPAGGGGSMDGDHDATYQKILREQGLQAATKWHLANPPKK